MEKPAAEKKEDVIKLGYTTQKADLYLDYLIRLNKKGGSSFIQVNEKEGITLHVDKK